MKPRHYQPGLDVAPREGHTLPRERTVRVLEQLLESAALTHPCDLDLLLFFHRHPNALMTSEILAHFLGYDLPQLGKSLDLLVERGFLLRSQNPTHFARLYRFAAQHVDRTFGAILEIASTREGRRELRRLIRQNHSPLNRAPEQRATGGPTRERDRPENAHA